MIIQTVCFCIQGCFDVLLYKITSSTIFVIILAVIGAVEVSRKFSDFYYYHFCGQYSVRLTS